MEEFVNRLMKEYGTVGQIFIITAIRQYAAKTKKSREINCEFDKLWILLAVALQDECEAFAEAVKDKLKAGSS